MNDMIPKVKITGGVIMESYDIYTEGVDVAMLRKRIGMVFQKPNVFPASIYDNIAVGPKQHGTKHKNTLDEIVETTLRQVNLWEEVKDNLRMSGLSLLPGQQQRLCIARALAVEPEVILMDESCSALDPGSTLKIEDLMLELSKEYAIMIVTHNMEQARRVSDMSIFMMIDENRAGNVVEYGNTSRMFSQPKDKRTEDYITGRFG
jgi:phosphate transport system ATP-binding protein